MPFGDAFDVRSRVVFNLLFHRIIHLTATHCDWMCRAYVGTRRHGGNMGRHRDEDSCRGGSASRRGDEHDHRDGRTGHIFDHQAHGGIQSSGSIQLEDKSLCARCLGIRNGVVKIFSCNGVDDTFIGCDDDVLGESRVGWENQTEYKPRSYNRRCEETAKHSSRFLTTFKHRKMLNDERILRSTGYPIKEGRSVANDERNLLECAACPAFPMANASILSIKNDDSTPLR